MTMIKAYFKPSSEVTLIEMDASELEEIFNEHPEYLVSEFKVVPEFYETGEEWGIQGSEGFSVESHISRIKDIVDLITKGIGGWDFIGAF